MTATVLTATAAAAVVKLIMLAAAAADLHAVAFPPALQLTPTHRSTAALRLTSTSASRNRVINRCRCGLQPCACPPLDFASDV